MDIKSKSETGSNTELDNIFEDSFNEKQESTNDLNNNVVRCETKIYSNKFIKNFFNSINQLIGKDHSNDGKLDEAPSLSPQQQEQVKTCSYIFLIFKNSIYLISSFF